MTRQSNDFDRESHPVAERRGHSSIDLEDDDTVERIDDEPELLLDDDDSTPGDRRRDPLRRP